MRNKCIHIWGCILFLLLFNFHLLFITFIRATKNIKLNRIKLWKRWHDYISLMDLSKLSGCLLGRVYVWERREKGGGRSIRGHTLSQLIYLSDKIMDAIWFVFDFPVIRLFLLRWASSEIQENVSRISEASVEIYKRKYRRFTSGIVCLRHCTELRTSQWPTFRLAALNLEMHLSESINTLRTLRIFSLNLFAVRRLEYEVYSHRTYCWRAVNTRRYFHCRLPSVTQVNSAR